MDDPLSLPTEANLDTLKVLEDVVQSVIEQFRVTQKDIEHSVLPENWTNHEPHVHPNR